SFVIRHPQIQKLRYLKVKLFIYVGGFQAVYFEHEGALAQAVAPLFQGLTGEYIEVGVFLVNGREVLGAQQNSRVVVDGSAQAVPQAGLQARYGKKRIVGRIVR